MEFTVAVSKPKPTNPFTPRFGSLPPVLGGREDLLDRLARAQDNVSAPEGAVLLMGPRGMGKTAVLHAAAGEAAERNWDVISVSTADGPLAVVVGTAAVRAMPRTSDQWHLSQVRAAGVGFSRSPTTSMEAPAVRYILSDLADRARRKGRGVLLAVDELHAADIAEAKELASAIQHVASGDGQPLIFIGSGLPEMATTILQDRGMTFFRRCHRAELGIISDNETRRTIRETVVTAGGAIDDEALEAAVVSVAGYPYRLQLVGFHAWEQCVDPVAGISTGDIRYASQVADADTEASLMSSPLYELSDSARQFLAAMEHDRPTSLADIVQRMGGSCQRANHHRTRLIEQGLIAETCRGRVEHAHPEARFWLARHDSGPNGSTPATRQRVVKALKRNPKDSYAQIARDMGISRTYVRNIAVEAGLERNSRKRIRA